MIRIVKSDLPPNLYKLLVENGHLKIFLDDCNKYQRDDAKHSLERIFKNQQMPDEYFIWYIINYPKIKRESYDRARLWARYRLALQTNIPLKRIFNFYNWSAYCKLDYRGELVVRIGCQEIPASFIMDVHNKMMELDEEENPKSYIMEEYELMRVTLFWQKDEHLIDFDWGADEDDRWAEPMYHDQTTSDTGEICYLVDNIVKIIYILPYLN